MKPALTLKRLAKTKTFLIFVVFLGYLMTSMLWNAGVMENTKTFSSVALDVVVLLFVCIAFLQVRKDLDLTDIAMSLTILGAGVSASILLIAELTDFNLARAGAWNVWSVAAIAYGFSAVVATYYAVTFRRTYISLAYGSIALVSLAAVMLIHSQVVFFGSLLALVSLSFAALWESRFRRESIVWAVGCMLLMILVLVVFNELMEEKRSAIWASTVDAMFHEGLMFGAGYPSVSTPVVSCAEVASQIPINGSCVFQHPHNLFVSTIYQLGLFGFLILFSFYLLALSVLFEQSSKNRMLLGGCLSYGGAIFMFDGQLLVANMNYVWLLFWLPMFLIVREEFLNTEI